MHKCYELKKMYINKMEEKRKKRNTVFFNSMPKKKGLESCYATSHQMLTVTMKCKKEDLRSSS